MKIIINIQGEAKSGKSTIASVISKAIRNCGFKVNIQDDEYPIDIRDETYANKRNKFNSDIYFRNKIIKEAGAIEIKNIQLGKGHND